MIISTSMLSRYSRSLCPFCESLARSKTSTSWQQQRWISNVQDRKPSRMVLSNRVARGPPPAQAGTKTIKRSRNSPFAAMNRTEAPQILHGTITTSAAEQRRSERHVPVKKRSPQKDPMRALKMQRRLASVSYETRDRIKNSIKDREEFDEFDLLPAIKESISSHALGGLVDIAPTPIQRLAIPALLGQDDRKKRKKRKEDPEEPPAQRNMQQFLLAAETGSGKTLAYLLPVIDAMKKSEGLEATRRRSEESKPAIETKTKTGYQLLQLDAPDPNASRVNAPRPRVIILLPTAELVAQVGALVKNLSHKAKYRTALASTAFTSTVIKNQLYSSRGVDVVVATPHLFNSIVQSDPYILSCVSHIVVDEADSLLDRSFSPITSEIIDRTSSTLQQLIFCSATIPRSLDSYLNKRYPSTKRLVTPSLHTIPRRVQLSVVDIEKVPYQGNRDVACAQTILDLGGSADEAGRARENRILVFVNEREKTIELSKFFCSKGIDAHALSRDSDDRKQSEILAHFTGAGTTLSARNSDQAVPQPSSTHEIKDQPRDPKVLVMTDLGSRGIDTLLVRTVILYDVPRTSIDFIHRLGRVGRMGRRGRGIVLVGKNDRKDIVREVREGMFKGQALI